MASRPRLSQLTDDEHHGLRRARLAARKRRFRWAAVLVAAAIVGAAGTVAAFAFTDHVPATTGETLSAARFDGTEPGSSRTSAAPVDAIDVRPLSHEDPLRLWIGGDSLAGALGPALGERLGGTGIVAGHVDYKVSSGLEPGVRDWPEYATDLLVEQDPEAIVFMIGTNDVVIVNSQDANDDGVADWEPAYRGRVAAMMDQLVGGESERTVVWIGAPTMRDDERDEDAVEINRVMREEAERRGPYVIYVDAYTLFADEDGEYADRLTNAEGETVRVRVGDGVHFTPLGAEYLAEAVFALLDGRFRLTAQADIAQPLGFTMDENGESTSGGSGSGSGSGRSNNSNRSGGGSGSRSTTTVASSDDDDDGETTPTSASETPDTTPPATSPPTTPTSSVSPPENDAP